MIFARISLIGSEMDGAEGEKSSDPKWLTGTLRTSAAECARQRISDIPKMKIGKKYLVDQAIRVVYAITINPISITERTMSL